MSSTNTRTNTRYLTRMAVLIAVMLLMEATGLGMIRTAGLEITILQVPVVIGAIVLGPSAGAALGAVFGAISFWECFGRSAFGAVLLGIDPLFTLLTCMVPRILMGLCTGLIFKGLYRIDRTRVISFALSSLCGALLNTVFFMTFLMVLFGRTEFILNMRGEMSVLPFVIAFVGFNGLTEAIVCFVSGAAISKALVHFLPAVDRTADPLKV